MDISLTGYFVVPFFKLSIFLILGLTFYLQAPCYDRSVRLQHFSACKPPITIAFGTFPLNILLQETGKHRQLAVFVW